MYPNAFGSYSEAVCWSFSILCSSLSALCRRRMAPVEPLSMFLVGLGQWEEPAEKWTIKGERESRVLLFLPPSSAQILQSPNIPET